jgi:hypothetical protein
MNNSVQALCGAVIRSLKDEVLPCVADPYARGQLAAALYVLGNFERAAGWRPDEIQDETARTKAAVDVAADGLRALGIPAAAAAPSTGNSVAGVGAPRSAEEERNSVNAEVCALFDCLDGLQRHGQVTPAIRAIEDALLDRVIESVQEEKRRIAPSMMKQMTGG